MATKKEKEAAQTVVTETGTTVGVEVLAEALTRAIRATEPLKKKTVSTRKKDTPWTPKDGSPKLKTRRKMYHHGIPITNRVSNEEIELLNQVKPGHFCEGFVKVTLRKDRGIDIDYPVKTTSQRLMLVNRFGIRTFSELLQRLINEAADPTKFKRPDDLDD